MNPEKISVSWVSFNNDPYLRERDGNYIRHEDELEAGPTLEFLFNRESPVAGQIKKHYMLVRRTETAETGGRRVHSAEVDVASELEREIINRQNAPDVEMVYWDTHFSPTDHKELFRFTARTLARIRRNHAKAQIIVNISPGTPAAQTVMLLALQARIVGENVLAYQGIPKDKRRTQEVMQEVNWNLLAEIAKSDDHEIADEEWTIAQARSEKLRKVAELVQRYGSVPFPVLIIGNRGTGKTHIANSLRKKYLDWKVKAETDWHYKINCAEFQGDPTIFRSSLFGYVKGSHSTALKNSVGLLEQAAGDCVFLDEIHWMDPQAQGALLLALQRNGSFRKIGGGESIKANFRLIAATNRSRSALKEALAPDFLDRISELIIELPDLRDCPQDLDNIWISVVRRACEELAEHEPERAIKHNRHASPAGDYMEQFRPHQHHIVQALKSMRLDGNYRDLERLARRLLVGGLQIGRLLSVSLDLVNAELAIMRSEESGDSYYNTGSPASLQDELPSIARCSSYLREMRDKGNVVYASDLVAEWERRLFIAAQNATNSGTKAAELLGMNPRTYNARMKDIP